MSAIREGVEQTLESLIVSVHPVLVSTKRTRSRHWKWTGELIRLLPFHLITRPSSGQKIDKQFSFVYH